MAAGRCREGAPPRHTGVRRPPEHRHSSTQPPPDITHTSIMSSRNYVPQTTIYFWSKQQFSPRRPRSTAGLCFLKMCLRSLFSCSLGLFSQWCEQHVWFISAHVHIEEELFVHQTLHLGMLIGLLRHLISVSWRVFMCLKSLISISRLWVSCKHVDGSFCVVAVKNILVVVGKYRPRLDDRCFLGWGTTRRPFRLYYLSDTPIVSCYFPSGLQMSQ